MKTYNYSEVRHNFSTVFNAALQEDVIITRKDGRKFKLASLNKIPAKGKSPLAHIKGIKADVTMDTILGAIREGRERAGTE